MKIVKKGVKKSKGYTRKPKVYHEEDFKEIYVGKTIPFLFLFVIV